MSSDTVGSSAADGFEVRAGPELVEGWAPRRLPFEPEGLMLDYRNALRDALGRLHPSRVLYCAYTATDASRCDLENVLLYNLGLGAFGHLDVSEVVVERFFAAPPACPDGLIEAEHHHLYQLISRLTPPGSAVVARWPPTDVDPPWTVDRVWSALRQSVQPLVAADPSMARLSLEVTLEHPPGSRHRPALSAMKAVVDALIATLHAHSGSHADEIAARLSARLHRAEAGIVAELMDDSAAVLGRRRLLWPYRRFVQWNPADDCLDFIRVSARPGEAWRIGGRLQMKSSIAAAPQPHRIAGDLASAIRSARG